MKRYQFNSICMKFIGEIHKKTAKYLKEGMKKTKYGYKIIFPLKIEDTLPF